MTVRLGLVGAGHMGRLHSAKALDLKQAGVDLAVCGVADLVRERAEEVAKSWSCPATRDYRDLLKGCDAFIVAVPTVEHYSVLNGILEARCDVLVEKPIAATVAEAERLLELAKAAGCLLQVGHLEWFNTAMQVIHERIKQPRFAEVHRMGPFSDRSTDIDVVRDLMIHDLDILQQLIGEEPERIEAVGIPVLTPKVDIANARLTFPGGCIANLTASRVSNTPMRKIRFFQRDGYFSIDFLEQSAVAFRREFDPDTGAPKIQMEKIDVNPGDALRSQLEAFLRARTSREKPAADGNDGLGALRTALRVIDVMPKYDDYE